MNIQRFRVPTLVLFIITAILIIYFFPRESKSKYAYSQDKPWQYGLLTAPFDFHIQKNENEIQTQKDSIQRHFIPYYLKEDAVSQKAMTQFVSDAEAIGADRHNVNYVKGQLEVIYKAGILSVADYDLLKDSPKKQLRLKEPNANMYNIRNLTSFFTPRQAYERIMNNKPESYNLEDLMVKHLDNYLSENVLYDERTSLGLLRDETGKITLYDGMIQSGEKIIDRGEIVDNRTFNILNSYTKEMEDRGGDAVNPAWLMAGQILMICAIIFSLMTYLWFFRRREYVNRKDVSFILLFVAVFSIITAILIDYKEYNLIYVIPFTLPTILIRTFIDSRTATVTQTITVMLCALIVPEPAEFIVVQIMTGFVCVFSLRDLRERSQLVYCGILILLSYIISYTGWNLCTTGDISHLNWRVYLLFCINFIFVTFSYLLVYVCEKVFGFISEVSMIELSNINRPLLQRLSEVAPGTFQHSMQVSNLVSAAATKIGANASLARTGALYHDIGKITNAAFFTENQSPGMDPHAKLSCKESAQIIINHVQEGVRIAKKYKLPQQIINFIETHHGKGKARYFYNLYANEHPGEKIDDADFSYPGPNPFSKEAALLMMADTVEAASRSLKEYTEESITNLVNKLIDAQVAEGMFKNAPITFRDVETAKLVFIDKLARIYHSRIAYPELKKDENNKKDLSK